MNIKTKLLKKIDAILGPTATVLARFFISPRAECDSKKSILIIRPGGIGDAVLLLPAIKALQKVYPEIAIDILAEKRNSDVFSLCSGIRRLFLYDVKWGLFEALRSSYDIVIDTEQWYHLSAVVAFFTRAPLRVGFGTNARRSMFNHPVTYHQEDYEVESFLQLVREISVKISNISTPCISIPEESRSKVKQLISPLTDKKILAVFPGGSIPEKRWPEENFKKVAMALHEEEYNIIAIGGKGDRVSGDIIAQTNSHSLNLCGKLTLAETAAVLKEAALLVTNDSGIMHLAAVLGTRTLSIFGPGNHEKWAPKGKWHAFISTGEKCSPCTLFGHIPPCKNDMKCIKDIRAEEVIEKALTLLKQDRHESN